MTERPTEQTHQRLTGLGAPGPEARPDARWAAPGTPTLPPVPQEATPTERAPLTERLQQRVHAGRQATTGRVEAPTGAPAAQAGTPTADPAAETVTDPAGGGTAGGRPVDGQTGTT